MADDCVKHIAVRRGAAILFTEFGAQPARIGDAVLQGANTLCGGEPEGSISGMLSDRRPASLLSFPV